MWSVAGTRVKKLSTTGTFHSQGAERNCRWQEGAVRKEKGRKDRGQKRERTSETQEERYSKRDIVLCSTVDTQHDIRVARAGFDPYRSHPC